jgi:periplasmic protein TonB
MQYMLREQSTGKSLSRFGLVVGAHMLLGVVLITTLNRTHDRNEEPPPVTILPPAPTVTPPTPDPKPVKHVLAQRPTLPDVQIPYTPPVVDKPAEKTITFTPAPEPTTARDIAPTLPTSTSGTQVTQVTEPVGSQLGVACPNAAQVQSSIRYPVQAVREGIEGDVIARFVVAASGEIKNIIIVSSANRVFNNVVTQAVQQFGCQGQGRDVWVEAPFSFRLN